MSRANILALCEAAVSRAPPYLNYLHPARRRLLHLQAALKDYNTSISVLELTGCETAPAYVSALVGRVIVNSQLKNHQVRLCTPCSCSR